MSASNPSAQFLQSCVAIFQSQKKLAERAMEQVGDADLHWRPDGEANSIATIVRHLAGNMISRWTDFLTTDGEKPERNRDTEFIEGAESREDLMRAWEQGWERMFTMLAGLTDKDVLRTVYIRGEAHTVIDAVIRQISHYGYHVGQIVFLAKHRGADHWSSLSIPRGMSPQYLQSAPGKGA